MGKITEFKIILPTNKQVYYPGEEVIGEVIVNLSKPMDVKKISVKCRGNMQGSK